MTDYTKKQHDDEIREIQTCVDKMVEIFNAKNLTEGLLKGKYKDKEITLQRFVDSPIRYFIVRDGNKKQLALIQIYEDNSVADSSKFSKTDTYLSGHIQFAHDQRSDIEAARLYLTIVETVDWQLA